MDESAYGEEFFSRHHRNVYARLFGYKGYVGRWLRKRMKPNDTILDIGCGIGLFLEDLQWCRNRFGIDISPEAISIASKRTPAVEWSTGDFMTLDIHASYDVVTLFDVTEHLPDGAIEKAALFVKPGGLMILSTPNTRSIGRRIKREKWFGYHPTHVNLKPPEEWLSIVRSSGFEIVDRRYDGLWDTPYFIPKIIEQFLVQLPSVLAFNFGKITNPAFGENIWIIARKTPSPGRLAQVDNLVNRD
jgi:SAM-dependent methyltransferase